MLKLCSLQEQQICCTQTLLPQTMVRVNCVSRQGEVQSDVSRGVGIATVLLQLQNQLR